jgi:SAM-dependent methyltransferase
MQIRSKVRKITPRAVVLRILEKIRSWCHERIIQLTGNQLKTISHRELTLPEGETEQSLFRFLSRYNFEHAGKEEMENYLREDFKRFLYTLQLVPAGQGRLLEIGSNPYFMTMLLQKFTQYELHLMNFFTPEHPLRSIDKKIDNTGKEIDFEYWNVNIEKDNIPFPDHYFDVVLCCEVIEHLTHDPMKALLSIKQKLRSGGILIFSTPNVARLENVSRMLAGVNIYDPYSGYGPYGRHNREYNRHELNMLLTYLGFHVQQIFTADVNTNRSESYYPPQRFLELLRHRSGDLGQYIFGVAVNSEMQNPKKPEWLYRSYAKEEMAST